MSTTTTQRIAIFRLSALGDLVMARTAVNALLRHLPQAQFTWFIDASQRAILGELPRVEFIGLRKPRGLCSYFAVVKQLREAGAFDALLAMQASGRAHLLYPWIKARRKIGYHPSRGKDGHRWVTTEHLCRRDGHLVEEFAEFARHLGANPQPHDFFWDSALEPEATGWVRHQTAAQRYVVMHLASSKPERDWPLERYVALARQLKATYPRLAVVLTGGPSQRERELARRFLQEFPEALSLVGQSTLAQLRATCALAQAIVSPDSAPVHLAAAYRRPVVGLYAVARPELSGPYGQLQNCVNAYPQAVSQLTSQAAESVDWHFRVHHPEAMQLISVEMAWQKLYQVLETVLD